MAADHRVNMRLPTVLAEYITRVIARGEYETSSEYIRDLIRRDMARNTALHAAQSISAGYRDIAQGRYFRSTGDFHKDKEIFAGKEKKGWK